MSMVWPTLGSRTAKEQNRTEKMKGFWEAVTSAGPYAANNVHLAPDR